MPVKDLLEETIAKFNAKVEKDENLQKELECIKKKANIDLCTENYSFELSCNKIHSLKEGMFPDPDITITSDPKTVEDLIKGNLKPMKAWALKKIKIKGSLEDVMRLRKFF
jgi:putative sterol carrier protein